MASIKLDSIVHDPRLQMRVKGLDEKHVEELTEALKSKKKLGNIKCCRKGKQFFPFDGWHRIEAHKRAELSEIDADVQDGDLDQAALLAAQANATHGLKRSNEDKRRAVKSVLEHPNGKDWSDRRIADFVDVGDKLVAEIRADQLRETAVDGDETEQKTVVRVGKDGKKRKVKTSTSSTKKVSKKKVASQSREPAEDPEQSSADPSNPFKSEAERMAAAAAWLSQIAGDVGRVAEDISKFVGDGFKSLVNKDNIDIALGNIVDNLKVHAHTLRTSAPSCMCLDCEGRGCIFCSHRRYQTVGERKEAEARRTAKTGSRKVAGAVV